MPQTVKLLIRIIIFDIVIFFVWAIILVPFSPFSLFLAPLFFLLPKDLVSSSQFYGDILPLFIFPLAFIINLIYLYRNRSAVKHNIKFFLTNIFLASIPIALALGIIFGPAIANEKLHEYSVINNFSVTGEPTFILQQTAHFGNYNFLIKLPVQINTKFTGSWMGNFFNIRFKPSNEEALSEIKNCQFDNPYLLTANLQSPVGDKNPPGNYNFIFEYSFQGNSCNINDFTNLVGRNMELLNIVQNKTEVLKTFIVTPYSIENYYQQN